MAVILFRRMYDCDGSGISWRLHGQALPEGSIPIRFVQEDSPKLRVHDILAVKAGKYQKNLDRATALGLIDNMISDLSAQGPAFWDEYAKFVVEYLPEALPLAVKDLSKSHWHEGYLSMLGSLVRASADINFVHKGKTALEYAQEIHDAIPFVRFDGKRDHSKNVIETLQKAGAVRTS